jgi:hypothetical protein
LGNKNPTKKVHVQIIVVHAKASRLYMIARLLQYQEVAKFITFLMSAISTIALLLEKLLNWL